MDRLCAVFVTMRGQQMFVIRTMVMGGSHLRGRFASSSRFRLVACDRQRKRKFIYFVVTFHINLLIFTNALLYSSEQINFNILSKIIIVSSFPLNMIELWKQFEITRLFASLNCKNNYLKCQFSCFAHCSNREFVLFKIVFFVKQTKNTFKTDTSSYIYLIMFGAFYFVLDQCYNSKIESFEILN